MKYENIYKVDGEVVTQEEFGKAMEDKSLHKFEVIQKEVPETDEEIIQGLQKEVNDLKDRVAELESWQKLHITLYHTNKKENPPYTPATPITPSPFTWPNTNDYPWYPNIIYCAETTSCTDPKVKTYVSF